MGVIRDFEGGYSDQLNARYVEVVESRRTKTRYKARYLGSDELVCDEGSSRRKRSVNGNLWLSSLCYLGIETKTRGKMEKINQQSFIILSSRAIEIWW